MRIRQLAFGLELSRANDHALRSGDVGQHPGKQVLHELKGRDRPAELQSLLTVLERVLVSAHCAAGRFPADEVARHFQHARRVAERVVRLQPVFLRHATVLHLDHAVLDDLERNLVMNLFDAESGCRLVLDDEALDLVVRKIARPDDRDIAPWGIADPLLLAVEDPGVSFTFCRRRQSAGHAGANERFCQAEATDLLEPRHGRKPLLLLFLRAAEINRRHRQAAMDAEERRDRGIEARHLHRYEASQ